MSHEIFRALARIRQINCADLSCIRTSFHMYCIAPSYLAYENDRKSQMKIRLF